MGHADSDKYMKRTVVNLAAELDLHSAYLGTTSYLEEGIDAHFNARLIYPGDRVTGYPTVPVRASDYWKAFDAPDYVGGILDNVDGEIKCPITVQELTLSSRKAYQYPFMTCQTRLPTWDVYHSMVEWGLEAESTRGTGTAQFRYWRSGGEIDRLQAYVAGGGINTKAIGGVINWAIPSDAKTAMHDYSIKVNENNAEFFIDHVLVAVAVNAGALAFTTITGPPYQIIPAQMYMSPFIPAKIEVYGYTNEEVIFPLSPTAFFVSDGNPLPPRVYRLYEAGTANLFTDKTITAGDVTLTSHPVPIFGYQEKTINFRASEQGTLSVEMLKETDNWREYDTMGITQDKANTYSIKDELVLARVVYTPNTYPCTISEAEMVLR